MKNIHVLPTDKPSRLFKIANVFVFDVNGIKYTERYKQLHKYINQNIYITSDEEIKEGDFFYSVRGFIEKAVINYPKGEHFGKLILTTSQDLIKDGVQAIDDEFLEWFVKNPSCEWVDVWLMNKGYNKQEDYPYQEHYLIIIPKEEPKQDLPIVNGSYGCTIQTKKQEPKQETLEELKKWREEALIAHEINQKVIKKLMDEKSEQIDSEKKIDKILQKLEEIKIMINRIN